MAFKPVFRRDSDARVIRLFRLMWVRGVSETAMATPRSSRSDCPGGRPSHSDGNTRAGYSGSFSCGCTTSELMAVFTPDETPQDPAGNLLPRTRDTGPRKPGESAALRNPRWLPAGRRHLRRLWRTSRAFHCTAGGIRRRRPHETRQVPSRLLPGLR